MLPHAYHTYISVRACADSQGSRYINTIRVQLKSACVCLRQCKRRSLHHVRILGIRAQSPSCILKSVRCRVIYVRLGHGDTVVGRGTRRNPHCTCSAPARYHGLELRIIVAGFIIFIILAKYVYNHRDWRKANMGSRFCSSDR